MHRIRRTADEMRLIEATQLLRAVSPQRIPLRDGVTNQFLEDARKAFYRLEDALGEKRHA